MNFTKHLERILIEKEEVCVWGEVCGHPLLWGVVGVTVTGAVKWSTNKNSMKRAPNKNHSLEGVRVGGGTRYLCPLPNNNPHNLLLWSKTMLCHGQNEKTLHKGRTTVKNNSRYHTGQQMGFSGSGDVCRIASTRLWGVAMMNWTKRNRACAMGKQLKWGRKQQEDWNRTRRMRRTWKRREGHWKRKINTLQGSLWLWQDIVWGTSNKEGEKRGAKQEARFMELDQISGGRDEERE